MYNKLMITSSGRFHRIINSFATDREINSNCSIQPSLSLIIKNPQYNHIQSYFNPLLTHTTFISNRHFNIHPATPWSPSDFSMPRPI
jgi:hypothetical protein